MNTFKKSFFRLLVTIFFFQSVLAMATEPDPGTLTIYVAGDPVCSLKIEEGQVDLYLKEKGCRGGWNRRPSIHLQNARSAATIQLSTYRTQGNDINGCMNTDNYTVTLRTTKDNVTTSLDIWDLIKHDAGTVVVPGLRLIHKAFHHPEFITGISCVRIRFD
ncbi:hypothetical protein OH720_23230 [Pseudomonas sp. WJP1]|uniref:hypothetical protein n=1 Tax=Pseudomonas sp. WJP1 TaxID=2986947 RepID=UPI002349E562|nr:hypothetical protein [Pseudomonas sp. WJP1]WCM49875.1 hypothetical protein OH720_23230 [Pseudomonas sp. WJP1]